MLYVFIYVCYIPPSRKAKGPAGLISQTERGALPRPATNFSTECLLSSYDAADYT
jgi:hypothetical protein